MGSVKSVQVKKVSKESVEALALDVTIPGKSGWVATVDFEDGSRQIVDQVDGDTRWLVNGEWAPGVPFPKFWNGELARCTMPVSATGDVVDAIEHAVTMARVTGSVGATIRTEVVR